MSWTRPLESWDSPTAHAEAPADVALVLDAGGLIGVDRRDRQVGALLRVAQRERIPVRSSSAAVAQVWRSGSRQANLARVLAGTAIAALDPAASRRIGELLGHSGTVDVVDGHVALLVAPDDTVFTSDADDIGRLLEERGIHATLVKA
ncbi:MAG: hypothetical protein ACR2NB_07235 [Solirubrobacteraceae bacterium]